MSAEQIHSGLFALFAIIACGAAIAVVMSQNIVRMAFWLVMSLGATAGLFFLLDADFVGATQLLVYVGGTVVLLIFGVMLTASGPYIRIRMSPAEGVLAGGIGILFLAMVYSTVGAVNWENVSSAASPSGLGAGVSEGFNASSQGNTTRPLGLAFIGLRPDRDLGADIHSPLSTGYLLPFEIVSVHLLVVLIGAAYLARAKRRSDTVEE